jgi:2-octaprenyl-6-methoxyphenol hydroxylase
VLNHDILIVGGGAVGSSLALALHEQGFDVALVDAVPAKQRYDSDKDNRVFALACGSQMILERLQVWPYVAAMATPIAHIHVSNQGSFGAVRMRARDYDHAALGFMLASSDLQKGLQDRLAQVAVTQYCPATFQSMHIESDHAHVVLHPAQTIRVKLVIAADGMRSPVRVAHQVGSTTRDFDQQAIVALVQLGRDHDYIGYERFLKKSAIALLPYGERQCALIWSVDNGQATQLLALDDVGFLNVLQQEFGYRLGRLQALGPRMSYPLCEVVSDRVFVDKTVFVGNAMQSLHPIAAQGFNLALRNAALLTDILVQAGADDWSSSEVLARYATLQGKDLSRTRTFTNTLVRFFDDRGVTQFAPVRGALLRAFNACPPAKRYLLNGMLKGVDLLSRR